MRRLTSLLSLAALVALPAVASAQVATDIAITRQQIQTDRQADRRPKPAAHRYAGHRVLAAVPGVPRWRSASSSDQRIAVLTTPTAADTATDKELQDALTTWV